MLSPAGVALQLFRARVSRVRDLTHDVRELDLDLVSPREIAFVAGQFISFEIRVPGALHPVTRPYSIASPPRQSRRGTPPFNPVPRGPRAWVLFGPRPPAPGPVPRPARGVPPAEPSRPG